MPRSIKCDFGNSLILCSFLFTGKHPAFLHKSWTFSRLRTSGSMLFTEQKLTRNHRDTQRVLVALGKNSLFLAALLARKSRGGLVWHRLCETLGASRTCSSSTAWTRGRGVLGLQIVVWNRSAA